MRACASRTYVNVFSHRSRSRCALKLVVVWRLILGSAIFRVFLVFSLFFMKTSLRANHVADQLALALACCAAVHHVLELDGLPDAERTRRRPRRVRPDSQLRLPWRWHRADADADAVGLRSDVPLQLHERVCHLRSYCKCSTSFHFPISRQISLCGFFIFLTLVNCGSFFFFFFFYFILFWSAATS
jgi:hypothetical protein